MKESSISCRFMPEGEAGIWSLLSGPEDRIRNYFLPVVYSFETKLRQAGSAP
jgi:hypothetical protein